jgi:serine/threonine protein kinase/tetratricopeptide (TPR) repeat protein
MTPDDHDNTRNPSDAALDVGLAAAFGGDTTHLRPPSAEPEAGTVIAGKYRLSERIGEGCMGSVWVAHQTEPVKRKVAVKLIKAGMDSKAVLARFDAERQALAVMDHPNIAKVLDGGVWSPSPLEGEGLGVRGNVPYFVMELVKGVPITQFCDARKLTPAQRLELFVPVCQAIQHAHQKGVIHRDIKPSNVLVALYDDKPVPKVIDFGIAKATGTALTEHTLETGFGVVVGTPAYMSPEQASLNNLDIDTRSDVYSLGVLLYELLTGSPPFTRKDLDKHGLLEMLRVVREVEPPRPSHKLSTADALPTIAAVRGTEPKRLTGLLRNELDWVVMKALEKDRTRRYETANGFAADVLRYLSGEPVQAHPPSMAYRVTKFVRRNKVQVIAASLVFLALVAGVVGTTLGLLEARRQTAIARDQQAEAQKQQAEAEKQAGIALANETLAHTRLQEVEAEKVKVEAEKQRADGEKQVAHAVNDFLQNKLLAQADTTTQANQLFRDGGLAAEAKYNPTVKELLDRAAAELAPDKIEANFPKQPLVQAQILRTVGDAYCGVGEAATGIPFLTRSADLFKAKLGPDHPDTLASMGNLARSYLTAGRLDVALPLHEEALERMKAKLGPDHPSTLTGMNNLAACHKDAGNLDVALPLYEEALKLRKAKLGRDHPDTLGSMNNLALGYQDAGKLDVALPLFEETLELRKAKFGPDHPLTLTSMNNLARSYLTAGKLGVALPLYEEALKLRKAKLGPDHPDTLASMNNLATGHQAAGRLDLALPLYDDALKRMMSKLGPDHPHTLTVMNNLATGHQAAGRLDLALPLYEEALKLRKAKLGPDHPDTLQSMNNLATGYQAAGRFDLALPLYEEALKRMKAKLGPDHPDTRQTAQNLVFVRRLLDADDRYRREVAARGPKDINTLLALRDVAQFHIATGQLDRAEPQLAEVLAGLTAREPDDPIRAFTVGLVRRCLAVREKKEPDVWTTFNTQSLLGGALLGQKKYADAEPLLVKGYEGMKAREKTIPPVGSTRLPEALDRLIELYTATDKPEEAKKYRGLRAKYREVLPPPRADK